jgi:hypothetical protein
MEQPSPLQVDLQLGARAQSIGAAGTDAALLCMTLYPLLTLLTPRTGAAISRTEIPNERLFVVDSNLIPPFAPVSSHPREAGGPAHGTAGSRFPASCGTVKFNEKLRPAVALRTLKAVVGEAFVPMLFPATSIDTRPRCMQYCVVSRSVMWQPRTYEYA